MLSAIITVSETTPRGWVEQCRRSVAAAAEHARFPVEIVEVPGVPGHIGQAMLRGMAAARHDYLAWVDDDDFVLPNAFTCLHAGLAAEPEAVCAREVQLFANGHVRICTLRHHLTAWRRDVAERARLQEQPAFPLVPMLKSVENTAIDEMSWVYMRRLRVSGGQQLRSAHATGI